MDRMRSWNSSEYESCGLQPYEISHGGGEKKCRKEEEEEEDLFFMWRVEELLGEVCMSEERTKIRQRGIWIKEIGIEQVFIYLELIICKQEEGGSFACGIKKGNKVSFGHAEDSATFVTMSCLFFFGKSTHGMPKVFPEKKLEPTP